MGNPKDGLTPETRAQLANIKQRFPGDWLLKVSRVIPGQPQPSSIPADAAGGMMYHRITGGELEQIEGWMLRQPLIGGGHEYICSIYVEKQDGQPKGAPKATFRINLPNPTETLRIAKEGVIAQTNADLGRAQLETTATLVELQKIMGETQPVIAEQAQMIAAATPATDPGILAGAQKAIADALERQARAQTEFNQQAAGLTAIMSRAATAPAAAAAAPNPWAAAGYPQIMATGPNGQAVPVVPYNLNPPPQQQAPQAVKVEGGYIIGTNFVPVSSGGGGAEVAALRAEMQRQTDEMRRQLDAEREARREAERKADMARADAERREQAARHESDMRSLRESQERQNADVLRRLEERDKRGSGDSDLKTMLPVLMQANSESAKAAIASVSEAARASREANDKIVEFMKENQSPDAAEQAQKMMSAVGDFVGMSQAMNGALLRQALQAGGTKPDSPVASAIISATERLGQLGITLMGGGVPGAGGPPVDPNAPIRPQLPPYQGAPELPPAQPRATPGIADALLASAREDARAGRVQDSLVTIQAAFRKQPALIHPGEAEVQAVIRLLDGYLPTEVLAQIANQAQGATPGPQAVAAPAVVAVPPPPSSIHAPLGPPPPVAAEAEDGG